MKTLLAVLCLTSLPLFAVDTKLTFKKTGKEIGVKNLEELQSSFSPKVIEVFEYQNEEKRSYRALPLNEVMDRLYGEAWRKFDDVLFTCADGYQPVVPVGEFLKHSAYLAFAAESGKFSVTSKIHQNQTISLGPFYLIWNNLSDPVVMGQGPSYWPYQLIGIDLVNFAEKYPKTAPPKGASLEVRAGFSLFRRNCMGCHTLNGEGGQTSGVELNRPISVTRYFKRDWLAKWITNSQAVRETSKMPAYEKESGYKLPREVRERQIRQIIAYLEAMAPAPAP